MASWVKQEHFIIGPGILRNNSLKFERIYSCVKKNIWERSRARRVIILIVLWKSLETSEVTCEKLVI
jgi:hypothetical protein